MDDKNDQNIRCPLSVSLHPQVLLAHGGGGKLMHRLISEVFAASFANPNLQTDRDSAVLPPATGRLAFTTDSFVVDPLFFPGGDIGSLAVNGTVNDLAMSGARPQYLSAGFIVEEGFATGTLWRIARSMKEAADSAGVLIVTGDTKVVERGHGHSVFINTSGIGALEHDQDIAPAAVSPGDVIIVSGDVGRHGIAVLAEREGMSFETPIVSDCAPVADAVDFMLKDGVTIHCLRDLTRGGLATALIEIANSSGKHLSLREADIPVSGPVRGACEILGFDPAYVANEGRFVAIVPPEHADRALAAIARGKASPEPRIIGRVTEEHSGILTMTTLMGTERILEMHTGDQLPRIC